MKPNKFSFSIGGFMGKSFNLVTGRQGKELTLSTYERGEGEPVEKVIKIASDWWDELETLIESFNDWQRHYENSDILDGTSWSIRTRVNGKVLISDGLNAYPNEPSFLTPLVNDELTEFDRLLAFLSETAGEEIF